MTFALSLHSQELSEMDFQSNGKRLTGSLKCNGRVIANIQLSESPKIGAFVTVDLIPQIPYITGFQFSNIPERMIIQHGFNGKKLQWSVYKEYKESDLEEINAVPILDPNANDSLSVRTCAGYTIQLPIIKNLPPVERSEIVKEVFVGVGGIDKEYNLKGGTPGEHINLFKDEHVDKLKFEWVSNSAYITNPIPNNGVIRLRYNGAIDNGGVTITTILKASDELNQESGHAILKFKLTPKYKDAPCVWTDIDGNKEIIIPGIKYEGELIRVAPFKATDPLNPTIVCDITATSLIEGLYNYKPKENESFTWTPSYSIVEDFWMENPKTVKIPFRADNAGGAGSDCKLVFQLGNSTQPRDSAIYNEAIAKFDQAQKTFIERIREPLCVITYSSGLVASGSAMLESVSQASSKFDEAFVLAASSNPITAGVYTGLTIIIGTFQGINNNRAEAIKTVSADLKNRITDFNNKIEAFDTYKRSLKRFKTNTEVNSLLEKAIEIEESLLPILAYDSRYTTIISSFRSSNKRSEIRNHCRQPVIAAQ